MRKFRKITALLLCLVLCAGMACISVSAATLDFADGYLKITDDNGNDLPGVYDSVSDLKYCLHLYIYDADSDEYVEQEILSTDSVKVERLNKQTEKNELVATGVGNTVFWTVKENGYYDMTVTLTRGENVYQGYATHWIGTPRDIQYAALEYSGMMGSEGFLYTGKSIKKDIKVYYYMSDEYLVEGKDYKISLTNAKGPGDGKVTVTGIGNYTGTLTEEYTIYNPSAKFKDVNPKGWYVSGINFAVDNGLFTGTSRTTFEPDAFMTRAMFVTVIGRFMGLQDAPNVPSAFEDVDPKQYYCKYVTYAYALGIVKGDTETRFAPDALITREQMCAMIARLNTVLDAEFEKNTETKIALELKTGGKKFKYHKKISSYAKSAVYGCRNAGIVNGKLDNYFDPKGNATRAEVATIMKNYTLYFANALMNVAE